MGPHNSALPVRIANGARLVAQLPVAEVLVLVLLAAISLVCLIKFPEDAANAALSYIDIQ